MRLERMMEKLENNGLPARERLGRQLCDYLDLLQDWNQRMDLTAVLEEEEMADRHFMDSLAVLKTQELSEARTYIITALDTTESVVDIVASRTESTLNSAVLQNGNAEKLEKEVKDLEAILERAKQEPKPGEMDFRKLPTKRIEQSLQKSKSLLSQYANLERRLAILNRAKQVMNGIRASLVSATSNATISGAGHAGGRPGAGCAFRI